MFLLMFPIMRNRKVFSLPFSRIWLIVILMTPYDLLI